MLDHERHVLDSGTVVLTRSVEANDIVIVKAITPMGSIYEADDEAGLSSLIQSVLPRGTGRRDAYSLQDALAELGADLDAGSGADLGTVTLRATAATWRPALDLFLEVLTEPAFPEHEVTTEIEQTLGTIRAREDQLMTRAMDLFRGVFYRDHPLHRPSIGYAETVRALDREALVAGHQRFYRPVPRLIVAVGRFEADVLIDSVRRALGREVLGTPPAPPPPPVGGGGDRTLEVDRDAAYIVYGFPAPDLAAPDYAATRILNAILGGGMSSRLFVELREKRSLGYQVSSMYRDRMEGSFLAGYIVTDPARVAEAADGLAREFQRVVDEPVLTEEIEAARTYLRGTHLMGAETNAGQAGRIGAYEAYGLGADFGDRWLASADDVSPADVQDIAQRWLTCPASRAAVVPVGTVMPDVAVMSCGRHS